LPATPGDIGGRPAPLSTQLLLDALSDATGNRGATAFYDDSRPHASDRSGGNAYARAAADSGAESGAVAAAQHPAASVDPAVVIAGPDQVIG